MEEWGYILKSPEMEMHFILFRGFWVLPFVTSLSANFSYAIQQTLHTLMFQALGISAQWKECLFTQW